MKLLLLDNYDSFTYNLVQLIEEVSDIKFEVHRNNKISLRDVEQFDKILLSPGPGVPKDAGIMPELITTYSKTKSIFGVCLGLQAIGEAFGGNLIKPETVYHGKATPITIIKQQDIFKDCPQQITVGRYHSWIVNNKNLPDCLSVTAVDAENNIMALKHETLNVRGVQFHPESILSEYGELMIRNWLNN